MNHGERAKYYIEDTHLAIVSKDVFDRVKVEMKRRERIVRNNDGSIEASKNKFNSKYILGNLLVCEDCGASYRRRTERGKVLWRCATRIEVYDGYIIIKGYDGSSVICCVNML